MSPIQVISNLTATQPGVEPTTSWSQVQHTLASQHYLYDGRVTGEHCHSVDNSALLRRRVYIPQAYRLQTAPTGTHTWHQGPYA